ncbi:hypothetical protein GWN42_22590 [candidate division KSB1 bacterium]|nr:hypothetical protein [candidate division KSB1 bacterium]
MKNKIGIVSFVMMLVFIAGSLLYAREDGRRTDEPGLQLSKTTGTPRSTRLNINNMSHWLRADGWSARNPSTGGSGVIFPRGISEALAVIFQDGIIWGGQVDDGATPTLRVGGQTYNIGTVEGKILSPGEAESPDAPDVRIYRIRADYVTADLSLDAQELNSSEAELRAQYAQDWAEWPWEKGAPWTGIGNQLDGGYLGADGETIMGAGNGVLDRGEDANSNGILDDGEDANDNDQLDGEVPGIAGADQVVWTVANDLSEGATFGLYGSPPIGIEMQLTAWGYQRTDALGNMIFKQVKMIYKGTAGTPSDAAIDPMYICQWSDPDLGTYSDDFVGVDEDLSLAFVYNSSSVDNTYNAEGFPPPAAGYDFFQGVLVDGVAGEDRNNNGIDDGTETGIFNLQPTAPGKINLGMSSFGFFAAGSPITDPGPLGSYEGTIEWWNLLRGFTPQSDPNDPERFTTNDGQPTLFPLNGDPVAQTGDIDGVILPPGDRRMLLVTGPFRMAVGDTQEVVVSLIAGIGSDRLSSVAVVKFFDRTAQATFDNLFEVIRPPTQPNVRASGLDGTIVLNWGFDPAAVQATESQEESGFAFEGYNVYQLRTPNPDLSQDNAIKLATFDKVNEITTVLSEGFDQQSGVIIEQPVQVGTNSGIKRSFTVTGDAFRDRPLANDQNYFFAVTAYNATTDLEQTNRAFESTARVLTVRAQMPAPGNTLSHTAGEVVSVDHTGPSDGTVTPIVVDPTILTGDTYQVSFRVIDDTSSVLFGETVWDLTNQTTGDVLLADQTNQSGDDNYLIIDGFQPVVAGPPPGVKAGNMFEQPDNPELWGWDIPSGTRRFTWANAEFGEPFQGFFHAIGWASPFRIFVTGEAQRSPIPPAENVPVRLILAQVDTEGNFDPNDPNVSFGYRYLRNNANPPAQPEFVPFIINADNGTYGFQAFERNVPLSAWDMSDPDNPQRLVVGFLENNVEDGLVDGKWWPPNFEDLSNVSSAGPREWLFVFKVPYSETQDPAFSENVIFNDYPVMYWLTVARRGPVPFSPGGTGEDQFDIFPNIPNSPADEFVFSPSAPEFNASEQKEDALEQVGVFPNPYLGVNRLETSPFQRFVRFNHLPENTTIRIFNLAGTLVRTLPDDGVEQQDQYLDWDLRNVANLPVASGIYLAHVEMPGIGEKVLKVVVIQEEQFLDTF